MEFVTINEVTVEDLKSDDGITTQEMKEQDLIRRLEQFPSENPDCGVDCTLKLGFSYDQLKSEPRNDQKPRKAVSTMNVYGASSQVMEKNGMVNGRGDAYTRWAINGPPKPNWLPDMINHNNNMAGFGFYGPPTITAPAASNIRTNYGRYAGFSKPGSDIFHLRTEPEPNDPARRCLACQTTTTPLWRNGPMGAKSLCNACGIRYKKEERRMMGITESHSKPKVGAAKGRESSKKPKF